MKWIDDLPVDTGASDCADSSRLAGMMALANHPEAVDCALYLVGVKDTGFLQARRHTTDTHNLANDPRTFSRDQLLCLAAGLAKQNKLMALQDLYYAAVKRGNVAQNDLQDDGSLKPYGADWIAPHMMGAMAVASAIKPKLSLYEDIWLRAHIKFDKHFNSMGELNQLLAVCFMAGPKYVVLFRTSLPFYKDAIRAYWGGWRGEPELGEMIIAAVEKA
jgi:hypothetical protein